MPIVKKVNGQDDRVRQYNIIDYSSVVSYQAEYNIPPSDRQIVTSEV